MRIYEYFVYDSVTGIITEKIHAHQKITDHLPNRTERICLKHIDGILDNNKYFSINTSICRSDCYVDPSIIIKDKIKEGAEEDFDFFIKNGYHKPISRR